LVLLVVPVALRTGTCMLPGFEFFFCFGLFFVLLFVLPLAIMVIEKEVVSIKHMTHNVRLRKIPIDWLCLINAMVDDCVLYSVVKWIQ